MQNPIFYQLIDNELNLILEKYKGDKFLQKHRSAINNQKSYALLIWFLEFYGRVFNYLDFITDGDNDSSCDIVFERVDNQGNTIFYVVQSKWNNADNVEKDTSKSEILTALSDFGTILRGNKTNVNAKLAAKLVALDAHLKANGTVKFIFLSLSQYKGGADDNIAAFINGDPKIKFETIDIHRIKADYIDRKYKKIDPINPLETYLSPEEAKIDIKIVKKLGLIKIEKPYEAYVFVVRPKMIWELFKTYNFALFFKNVRNPLLQSQFNQDIEKTAAEEANLFWYYNNGITAITYLLPELGGSSEIVPIIGLQVINGAQTVYSIYRAYEAASEVQRLKMDSEALITFRLLKSGGANFDLNVTRYTNSQNPIQDRDFYANDDIQVKLQNASYNSNVWYEKRASEFRDVPLNINKIDNTTFALAYLAFHLQEPTSVFNNYDQALETHKNLCFISRKEHKDGLYEKIFNSNTTFEDMLASFYVYEVGYQFANKLSAEELFKGTFFIIIALTKTVFSKYFKGKYGEKVNVNKQIIKYHEPGADRLISLKILYFTENFFVSQVAAGNTIAETNVKIFRICSNLSEYEKLRDILENTVISANDIETVKLSSKTTKP